MKKLLILLLLVSMCGGSEQVQTEILENTANTSQTEDTANTSQPKIQLVPHKLKILKNLLHHMKILTYLMKSFGEPLKNNLKFMQQTMFHKKPLTLLLNGSIKQ